MIAILVCALIAAQLVTLALTVLLPPSPTSRWSIDEVVAALTNKHLADRLERRTMSGPPDVSGEGWLVSESSREVLARRLGLNRRDVVLAFYTQLPVGGVAVPTKGRSPLAMMTLAPGHRADTAARLSISSLFFTVAHAQSIPGGPGQANIQMRFPGGAFPGGHMPGGRLPGGGLPGGHMPGGRMPGARPPSQTAPGGHAPGVTTSTASGARQPQSNLTSPIAGSPSGIGSDSIVGGLGTGSIPSITGSDSITERGVPQSLNLAQSPGSGLIGAMSDRGIASQSALSGRSPAYTGTQVGAARLSGIAGPMVITPPAASHAGDTAALNARKPAIARPVALATGSASPAPGLIEDLNPVSVERSAAKARQEAFDATVSGTPQPIPFRRADDGLFAFTSPPFIEGDFIAAARQPDGRWIAVAPRAEPFPNAWQKRVMLWFALSLLITSPLAWLFVRRIVLPLRDFARAAEQLGRDPSAMILPLSGPAEIGRAANAFNQMRNRLRSFVDDRTAMVGAISHDLRTPLTRLRFRIEDVPDEQREGLLREVTEMEAMISQVIAFIRDASTPGPRERFDFADLIARSVDDAQLVGGDVALERNAHVPVDVDPVGIRRLIGNLLENAIKYGVTPVRVRAMLRDGEAVVDVIDNGPGIPEEEFDHAFEPFYRSEAARNSGQKGTGLGLAVCRSIARAHGGDVTFAHTRDGFVARLSLPAAYEQTRRRPPEAGLRKAA